MTLAVRRGGHDARASALQGRRFPSIGFRPLEKTSRTIMISEPSGKKFGSRERTVLLSLPRIKFLETHQ